MSAYLDSIARKLSPGGDVQSVKGISTLIGSILLNTVMGGNQLGNSITYITSYLRIYVSKDITYAKDIWFSSITVAALTMFLIIGGYMATKINMRIVLFLGVLIIAAGNFLCAYAMEYNFWLVVFTVGFMPNAGCGMIFSNAIVISIKWFPKRKGMITGLLIALNAITSTLAIMVQTQFVNPDNVEPVNDYIIDTTVLARVPVYFKIAALIFLVVGAVACAMCFEPPSDVAVSESEEAPTQKTTYGAIDEVNKEDMLAKRCDSCEEPQAHRTESHLFENNIVEAILDELAEDEFVHDDEMQASSSRSSTLKKRKIPSVENEINNNNEPIVVEAKTSLSVRKALKTRMALVLFITFGLSTEAFYFISIMAKPFGQFIKDDKFLALIISLGNFANCAGSFVCGWVMDRIKFKHTMLLVNCIIAASYFSLILCQYFQSKLLYAIWITLINFVSIGFFTSHLPEVMNKFGDKNASTIYGIIHVGPVISSLLFSQVLEDVIDSYKVSFGSEINLGYLYSFLIIGCLNFASMVILMIFYRTRTVI